MAIRGKESTDLEHSTGEEVIYVTARDKTHDISMGLKQTLNPKFINAKKWGEMFAAIGSSFLKRMDVTNNPVS